MFAVDFFAVDFFPGDYFPPVGAELIVLEPSGLRIQAITGNFLHSIPSMRYTNAIPQSTRIAIPDKIENSIYIIGLMKLLHIIPFSDRTDKGKD